MAAKNRFLNGNRADGKHYWLTPPDLMQAIREEHGIDFDPCPFPLPEGFDGLSVEWGQSSYVNPPFGVIDGPNGRKVGATAWARKAIAEARKGKKVVFVFPIHRWVLELIEAGAKVKSIGNVKWLATEDRTPGKGSGSIAMFVLDGTQMEAQSNEINENKEFAKC